MAEPTIEPTTDTETLHNWYGQHTRRPGPPPPDTTTIALTADERDALEDAIAWRLAQHLVRGMDGARYDALVRVGRKIGMAL